MSSLGFARIAAFIALGALSSADGIAWADSADDVELAALAPGCDFGWHPRSELRRHWTLRRVPHAKKAFAHGGAPDRRLATIVRREPSPIVVAGNFGLSPGEASGRCMGANAWSLLCPGFQVLGTSY